MVGNGWRLSRGRGSGAAQLPLAICAVVAIVIVLLGKAEASIFDRARAKLSDWVAPILEEVRDPLAGLERWVGGLGNFFSVYQENLRLKQENAELRRWQNAALTLERRIERYELLLHAVANSELPSISARVIGQSSHPFVKTMILNAGSAQKVKSGQAVVDDRGLIGRIYLTGERTSWVILLTDLNSRIPVVIQPSNYRAIMAGDNTPSPDLQIHELGVKVKAGDRVVSSGDGGLLPPDLPVGVVMARGDDLRVALYSDASAADFVHILDYKAPVEPPPGAAESELPATIRSSPSAAGGAAGTQGEAMTAPSALTGPVPVPRLSSRMARGENAQPGRARPQQDAAPDEETRDNAGGPED